MTGNNHIVKTVQNAFNDIHVISKFKPWFVNDKSLRYLVAHGGRGGLKSWTFARAAILKALQDQILVVCAREFQNSINDSVHRLLKNQINILGFDSLFDIRKTYIQAFNGSEFIFKGLRLNPQEIKSMEGADICWIEEGQSVSKESWNVLDPTIRKEGSQIWISFNPFRKEDVIYQTFVANKPPDNAYVVKVGWEDNPWLPDALRIQKDQMMARDIDTYRHIWGGEPLTNSDAQIFKGRYEVNNFITPSDAIFYHGADWGFASDPNVLIRCFIVENSLFIDAERFGHQIELDELPAFYHTLDTSLSWSIYADCSQPATISYLRRKGFKIKGAKKWPNSVVDGIAVLKGFDKIYIHPRCQHTIEEFNNYSYKTDQITEEVIPVIIDAHNHCIDSIRYALDRFIRRKAGKSLKDNA